MSMSWWDRITESAEARDRRITENLVNSDSFKTLVNTKARELVTNDEEARVNERRKKAKADLVTIEKAKSDMNTVSDAMRDSDTPWCILLSDGIDPELGLVVKLDWNDAMIRCLRKMGITGNTDDDVIQMYIGQVYNDAEREVMSEDYLMNGVGENELPGMSYDDLFKAEDGEGEIDIEHED